MPDRSSTSIIHNHCSNLLKNDLGESLIIIGRSLISDMDFQKRDIYSKKVSKPVFRPIKCFET